MLTILHRTIKNSAVQVLDGMKVGAWIHLEEPTENEITRALELLPSLDGDHVRDALDPFEVPRLEVDDGIAYCFLRVPYTSSSGRVFTLPFLIVIGKQYICTVTKKVYPMFRHFLENRRTFSTTQKSNFVLQLIVQTIIETQSVVNALHRRTREMTARVERISSDDLIAFVASEELLNDILSTLIPAAAIYERLNAGKIIDMYEDDESLIEDIIIDNRQLIESSKSTLKTIQNIRDAHTTIATQKLNRVMKLLTLMTIFLTVPTLFASLYGMNVVLPFAASPFAFHGVLAASLLVVLSFLGILTWRKWL
jgi:magnesium transporter